MLDNIFSAYNKKVLASAVQLNKLLKLNHSNWKEVEQYLINSRRRSNHPECPECGEPLIISLVNLTPRTQVGEKFKLLLACVDWKNCGYERYSTKTIREELDLLRRKQNGTR